jgi:CspA family cold shock protein
LLDPNPATWSPVPAVFSRSHLLLRCRGKGFGVPTGKVKWYDTEKGFGFLAADDGEDVYVHSSALPEGTAALKPGSRVEFGVASGKKGLQALSVRILEPAPSVVKATRKPADDMAVIVEDLIKLLDGFSNQLRRGRYPDDKSAAKIASMLRIIANDIDA